MNNENNEEIITSITKSKLKEIINECIKERENSLLLETTIVNSNNYKLSIGFYYSNTHKYMLKDPYFKVFDNESFYKAKYVARIKLLSPDYVIGHNNKDGKKEFKLSNSQVDNMISLLKSRSEYYDGTNWEYMCFEITKLCKENNFNKDYTKLKMPGYEDLKNK